MSEKNRIQKIVIYAVCTFLALIAVVAAVYMIWEKPPAVAPEPTAQPMIHTVESDAEATPEPTPEPTEEPIYDEPLSTQRQDGVYTILVAGVDVGGGNTDTIMVGKLDTVNHTLDIVSIPRDTLINVGWWVKKVNSAYAAAGGGDEGIAALKTQIKNLIGFDVDCYALVDLELFVQVVDAMGGVDYDVPIDMDYTIGPVIHIKKGYQHLDGEQALGLVRFRSGYMEGDLGRLDAQHDFLKAVAKQFIDLGNVPNLRKVLKLFETGLKTDLDTANIAYLVRQALLCDSEDINFYTMPNCPVMLREYSYVTCEIMDWFDMINAHLNPFSEPVGFYNVDIVYRDWDGSYHATRGLVDPGYFPTPEELAEAELLAELEAEEAARKAEEAAKQAEETENPEEPTPTETPAPTEAPVPPSDPQPQELPETPPAQPEPIGEGDSGEAQLG